MCLTPWRITPDEDAALTSLAHEWAIAEMAHRNAIFAPVTVDTLTTRETASAKAEVLRQALAILRGTIMERSRKEQMPTAAMKEMSVQSEETP